MSNHAPHPIMMAGIAQKLLNVLFLNCPPNYACGGPAFGAIAATDKILQLMGIGVTMLQRRGEWDTASFQEHVRHGAVTSSSIIPGFIRHKSQILSGALHSILANPIVGGLREPEPVTEEALMSVLEWFFAKTGSNPEAFWK